MIPQPPVDFRRSLADYDRFKLVLITLLAAFACLIAGVLVPVFSVTFGWWVFSKEIEYSIIDSIIRLWEEGEQTIGAVIFAFSVIFPGIKILILGYLYFGDFRKPNKRRPYLVVMDNITKWSMVDVFVVALLIVIVSEERFALANAGRGIFVFAASIVLSALALIQVKFLFARLSKRAKAAPN